MAATVHSGRFGTTRQLWMSATFTLLVFLGSIVGLKAHEGHDHGAPPTPVSNTIAPRVDASSTMFELIAVYRNNALTIFVDRFTTNEPVTGAQVEVDTPKGTLTAKENPDGTYALPAEWAAAGGNFDLIFTVTAGSDLDVLTGTLKLPSATTPVQVVVKTSWLVASAVASGVRDRIVAYDPTLPAVGIMAFLAGLFVMRRRNRRTGAAVIALVAASFALAPNDARAQVASPGNSAATQSAVDLAQRFPDGAIFVPKASQRILAIRTVMSKPEEHRRAIALAGRVIPDPSASGSVQTSLTGRLSPPSGGFPRLGQRVKAGDTLALVQPSLGSADLTSQQQQARELEQQIALVQRRLERLRPIANVIARSQIEDAELELKGLQDRRANLDRAPREPERLKAPVDGVIAAATASPGQVVEVNAIIFQIVNPDRLWI
ncbi:MAG: efflux RND transporter periplasmic adaptor subunit, partial [Bosea sp. (in: a-proteobacteria)]